MEKKNLFTSESVSEGHPDKVSDQIADAILDACLSVDPESRVACEVFCTTDYVLIGGEITTKAKPDYIKIVKDVLKDIGYTKPEYGFAADTVKIDIKVKEQSPDIAMGVDAQKEEDTGAGDQGIMFGYATDESEGYMPLPIVISHKLVRIATELRKKGEFKGARPDMKSQVTVDYSGSKPRIETVLMSIQHDPDLDMNLFKRIELEANARGIHISDMMRELLEIALLELLSKETENGKESICYKKVNYFLNFFIRSVTHAPTLHVGLHHLENIRIFRSERTVNKSWIELSNVISLFFYFS